MSVSALTRRYAKALVELGVEQKAVESYGDELAQVKAVLSQEELLRQLLDSPTLELVKKQAMLTDLCKAMELSTGMAKFLGLLLNKGRICFLGQMFTCRCGIASGKVMSSSWSSC